jgi:hypothetical protein
MRSIGKQIPLKMKGLGFNPGLLHEYLSYL